MRKLLVMFLLMSVGHVQAQPVWLHVMGQSWHNRSGYNGNNHGLGVEVGLKDRWSVALGTYRNSIDRDSVYVLGKYRLWNQGIWSMQLDMGMATGYLVRPVAPVILPELCAGWLCAIAIPRVGDATTSTLAAYVRIPLR